MHSNHDKIIVPNYPPPMLTASQHFFPVGPFYTNPPPDLFNSNPYDIYKTRLSTYLTKRNASKQPHAGATSTKHIKLSEVTSELRQSYDLIDALKQETSVNLPKEELQNKILELIRKKDELLALVNKYSDPAIQRQVRNAIEQRKAKRHRIQLRKAETKEMKEFEAKNRQRKHEQIDQCLVTMEQKITEERQRIYAEQRAEQVLADVKQRKAEAEQFLTLFDSLKELHRLRAKKKKDSRSGDLGAFSDEIHKLKKKWKKALKKYNEEEQRLRNFLDENTNLNEWRHVLFGIDQNASSGGANKLKNLISVRRMWDDFIVSNENPFGSTIPIGWVMPHAKPSDEWKKYQKNVFQNSI